MLIRGTLEQKLISKHLWNGTFESNEHVREFVQIMRPLYSEKANALGIPIPKGIIFSYKVLNLGFKTFLNTFDYESLLNKIKCETLVLSGRKDWINDPFQAELISNSIPRAKLHIFEDASHSIAIDKHDDYIQLVGGFIKSKPNPNFI